jgi:hypothetical protein
MVPPNEEFVVDGLAQFSPDILDGSGIGEFGFSYGWVYNNSARRRLSVGVAIVVEGLMFLFGAVPKNAVESAKEDGCDPAKNVHAYHSGISLFRCLLTLLHNANGVDCFSCRCFKARIDSP